MAESVRIMRIAAGGDGVGHLGDGRAVFVPRSAPGDLVELTAIERKPRFARARIGRLLEAGPDRVEPLCPHYISDECGGCQLQHLSLSAQRESRQMIAGEALRRLGKFDVPDPPLEPATMEWGYRSKITLHRAGRTAGFHRYDRAGEIFELTHCRIAAEPLNGLWKAAAAAVNRWPDAVEEVVLRLDREGGLHLLFNTGSAGAWSGAAALAKDLSDAGSAATIWRRHAGEWIAEAGLGGASTAPVFEQVNREMGDAARAHALQQMGDVAGRTVWDLYAGIGQSAEQLAARGAEVDSVEIDRHAVAQAQRLTTAPAGKIRFHTGSVEGMVGRLDAPDLVLANPPRVGMHELVAAELLRRKPKRLVYISCDPATLARDLKRLSDAYALTDVRLFDLFPQTAHIESVATMDLR